MFLFSIELLLLMIVSKSATVAGVEDITNVCEGGRVNGEHTIKLMLPVIEEGGGLYARLDEPNVASVNLGSSRLIVTGQDSSKIN